MKTKRIGVTINEDLWDLFRVGVKNREGRLNGVLSQQLEKALVYYMSNGETENFTDLKNKSPQLPDSMITEEEITPNRPSGLKMKINPWGKG